LTPEEQAKIEEARRKREERQAKRAAKKAAEDAKAAEQRAKQEAKQDEHLTRVLAKGYEALERQDHKGALAAFGSYVELAGADRFPGLIGLARTRLAMGEPAEAVARALEAAKATSEASGQAEALVLAGDASFAARPRDPATLEPLPGTELYETTALRFYARALAADPEDRAGARARLEERFPTPADETTERLYSRYREADPTGAVQHAKRLAAAYEALLSGGTETHVAVAGGITVPVKLSGLRPPYPPRADGRARRLLAALFIEPDGTVSRARLLNGADAKLDRAAVEVLETWRFEPARLPSGEPLPVHYVVAVNAVEPRGGAAAASDGGEPEPPDREEATAEPDASEDPPDQGEPEPDE
jgi:TonB family protein